jgi:hypothetical protein
MKVSHPNAHNPSPEELQQLEKFKALIERATKDGKLFREELETIQASMHSDKKTTPQELALLRTLINEKIAKGEVEYQWD